MDGGPWRALPLGGGVVRTRAKLRYRSRPSLAGERLGAWAVGERLDVWCIVGDWLFVQDNGQDADLGSGAHGWSHGDYVEWLKPLDVDAA